MLYHFREKTDRPLEAAEYRDVTAQLGAEYSERSKSFSQARKNLRDEVLTTATATAGFIGSLVMLRIGGDPSTSSLASTGVVGAFVSFVSGSLSAYNISGAKAYYRSEKEYANKPMVDQVLLDLDQGCVTAADWVIEATTGSNTDAGITDALPNDTMIQNAEYQTTGLNPIHDDV